MSEEAVCSYHAHPAAYRYDRLAYDVLIRRLYLLGTSHA